MIAESNAWCPRREGYVQEAQVPGKKARMTARLTCRKFKIPAEHRVRRDPSDRHGRVAGIHHGADRRCRPGCRGKNRHADRSHLAGDACDAPRP